MIPAVAAFVVSAFVVYGVTAYWRMIRLRRELELELETARGVAALERYLAQVSGSSSS